MFKRVFVSVCVYIIGLFIIVEFQSLWKLVGFPVKVDQGTFVILAPFPQNADAVPVFPIVAVNVVPE